MHGKAALLKESSIVIEVALVARMNIQPRASTGVGAIHGYLVIMVNCPPIILQSREKFSSVYLLWYWVRVCGSFARSKLNGRPNTKLITRVLKFEQFIVPKEYIFPHPL